MLDEIFRIIFDRRHIKDVRIWVLVVLLIVEAASFFVYDKYRMKPVMERQDRQKRRIHQIIVAGKLQARIDALPKEDDGIRKTSD